MNLEGIIAVTGKPGLFKIISQGKNAVILENLMDKKRMPLTARHQANTLDEIGIYTYDDTKPLSRRRVAAPFYAGLPRLGKSISITR